MKRKYKRQWTDTELLIVNYIAEYLGRPIDELLPWTRLIDLVKDYMDFEVFHLSYDIEEKYKIEFENEEDRKFVYLLDMVTDTINLIAHNALKNGDE